MYEPSKLEIVTEMSREFRDYVTLEFMVKAREAVSYFISGGLFVLGMTHAFPTVSKRYDSQVNVYSIVGGLALGIAGLAAYGYFINQGHPESLGFPAITNMLSYGYERAGTAKDRLVRKKTLDNIVSFEAFRQRKKIKHK